MEFLETATNAKDAVFDFVKSNWQWLFYVTFVLLTAPWGRRIWLKIHHIGIFFKGLYLFLFPKWCCEFLIVDGTVDNIHIMLCRVLGLVMLAQVLNFWMLSKSSDSTVASSIFWAYTIELGIISLAYGYFITHLPKKGIKLDQLQLQRSFWGIALLDAVNIFYLIRSNDWGGHGELISRKNTHLRLDFVFLLMSGIFCFAFPQWLMKIAFNNMKVDAIHVYITRTLAAMTINFAILSGRASNFLRDLDKDTHVLSHLVFYVSILFFVMVNSLLNWDNLTSVIVFVDVIGYMLLSVNAVGALDVNPACFNRILVPKVKKIPDDIRQMLKLKGY